MNDANVSVTATPNIGIDQIWMVISAIDDTIWFPTMVKKHD